MGEVGAALITGAGVRVGRAIALHLAKEGWDLGLHYNASEAPAKALADELRASGVRAELYGSDLTDPTAPDALAASFCADFTKARLLVNNASIYERDRLETLDPELWRRHLDINTLTPVLTARGFAAHVREPASVVNFLDQKLKAPTPDYFSYTLSKMALGDATTLLAMALAPKVRVNAVAPGLLLPSGGQTQAEYENVVADTPLGVAPTLEEICRLISFFADAPAVTGQVVLIDGGRHLFARGLAEDLARS